MNHFDGKFRPIGTSWVRRLLSRPVAEVSDHLLPADGVVVMESRKPRGAKRVGRYDESSIILSVDEILALAKSVAPPQNKAGKG